MSQIIFFILICSFVGVHSANLETVSDEELINLIKTEKYVVVLFTSKQRQCTTCDNYKNEMIHLIQDLNSLSTWVVEAIDSQLLRVYSDDKEPALVFFRHGVPLLYDGPLNAEEILTMFSENKEPTVKELTDDTFEHLTQASSGATTGDWFVMFGSTDCVECSRLIPKWEAVGAKLKRRVNVARIDKYTTGASTAKRFNVYETPEFIFFRHGKMYRYQIAKYDINSFTSFAKEYYKNVHAETVPVPQRRLDYLAETIAIFLREKPWISSIAICVIFIIFVVFNFRRTVEMAQKRD